MKEKHVIKKFPKSRYGTIDLGKISRKKHNIAALLEIDVTDAWLKIEKLKKKKMQISFTSWFIYCIADSLKNHKEVCGYLYKKNSRIIFDTISISLMVEKNISGTKVPLPLLIQNADSKTAIEICKEIQNGKNSEVKSSNDYVINNKLSGFLTNLYFNLPGFLRIFSMNCLLNNPFQSKKVMGNVLFTSLGSAALMPGWIIPKTYHNLSFALGSVTMKPWVAKKQIKPRQIAHLTIIANHDVADGAPIARFASDLICKLEKANGL
ncbi:MAG: 2-oxo acid dehydrogenase subunit E2 [Spirochaetes bacterium]|nr:2-oxo acid dehydrogenase subunit E2 [Spirochaetota bacterium]